MKKVGIKRNLYNQDSKEKGITLLVLVVTIVVLIILATVTINAVLGDNGLINQAQQAKDLSSNLTESDLAGMNRVFDEYANVMAEDGNIGEYPGGGTGENPGSGGETGGDDDQDPPASGGTIQDAIESGEKFENTTEIKDENGESVWIPGGFEVSDESATDVDKGIVITDGTNEFVWIPVPDYTTMYIEAPGTSLDRTSSGAVITTDVYSKLRVRSDDSYVASLPGAPYGIEAKVKEPDLLSDYNSGDASTEKKYGIDQIKNVLGITGSSNTDVLNNFARSLVEEYTQTYNSIKKYKGFYIGRYELTGTVDNPTVQKEQEVLTNENWYNLKKACNNLVSSSKYVQSEMIYGNQWDEVMSWLKATVFKEDTDKVDVDSRSWGNYIDSIDDAGTNSGVKRTSGYNEAWQANNIYDLAGNCQEWTQEAENLSSRVLMGRSSGVVWFGISCCRSFCHVSLLYYWSLYFYTSSFNYKVKDG